MRAELWNRACASSAVFVVPIELFSDSRWASIEFFVNSMAL